MNILKKDKSLDYCYFNTLLVLYNIVTCISYNSTSKSM